MYWLLLNTYSMIILLLFYGKVSSHALFGTSTTTSTNSVDENFSYKYDMKIIQRHSQAFALHRIIAQPIVSFAIKMKFLVSDQSCASWNYKLLTYHNGYCEFKVVEFVFLNDLRKWKILWFNPVAAHLLYRCSFHSSRWLSPSCSNNLRLPQNPSLSSVKSKKWTLMDRTDTRMRLETASRPRSRDPWRTLLRIRMLWWEWN